MVRRVPGLKHSEIKIINHNLVSITDFNQGKASKLFRRATSGEALAVLKNNHPIAYVLPPEEYELLKKLEKRCIALQENKQALSNDRQLADILSELRSVEENGDYDD